MLRSGDEDFLAVPVEVFRLDTFRQQLMQTGWPQPTISYTIAGTPTRRCRTAGNSPGHRRSRGGLTSGMTCLRPGWPVGFMTHAKGAGTRLAVWRGRRSWTDCPELNHERYAAEVNPACTISGVGSAPPIAAVCPTGAFQAIPPFSDSRDFTARAPVVACRRSCRYTADISV